MAVIERLDFLGVPTQDPERSRAFYRGVLGLRPDEHAEWEQWAGDTCFAIWEPEKQGMPFVAQKGNPWPLRCDDVAEMRAVLEAKGVRFFGDTFDTGVCHMAIFADPDGNELMLQPPVRAVRVGPRSGRRCCSLARGAKARRWGALLSPSMRGSS
jgi:catechol 2,3-dioxygenase-like lactoylglutathione lyase family enzyme